MKKSSLSRWLYTTIIATSIFLSATNVFLSSTIGVSPINIDNDEGDISTLVGTKANVVTSITWTDPSLLYCRKQDCKWTKKKGVTGCNELVDGNFVAEGCRESHTSPNSVAGNDNHNRLSVGVYYYPWWGDDFHRGNPDNPHLYLRRQLDLKQFPSMGEYDDRRSRVIAKQLYWSRKFNIDLWVTSWWGKGRREDMTIKNHILVHKQLRNHKIAIFYETTGRIREKDNYDVVNVKSDLNYLCREYFSHPNYFRMGVDEDGNADVSSQTKLPVLFVYLTRKLEDLGLLRKVIQLMREGAKEGGCDQIFIVGDQVFQGPPKNHIEMIPFKLLDAVTTYDVYGSMRGGENLGYIGSRKNVSEYYKEQNQWRFMANNHDCAFIPSVSPGFNDRGVRPEKNHIPLSRRLNKNSDDGSLFRAALEEAKAIVDPLMGNLLMINSWNEYHEDTQIEPVYAVDKSKRETNLPKNLTYGLEYKGYGNLFLKILKQETSEWDPSMVIPAATFGNSNEEYLSSKIVVHQDGIVKNGDTIGWDIEYE